MGRRITSSNRSGAFNGGDGITSMHHNSAGTRISPTEIWESRNPWLVNKIELAKDSCGAGKISRWIRIKS